MIRAVLISAAAAGRAMRERGSGKILNVSSTAGFLTMGAYSAIKAWVTVYSEGLANELRGTGVTVTALCPGWVRTEFHERADINTRAIPELLWLEADDLVAEALADADAGKVISIPSKRYAVLMGLLRQLPRGAVGPSRAESPPAGTDSSASVAAHMLVSRQGRQTVARIRDPGQVSRTRRETWIRESATGDGPGGGPQCGGRDRLKACRAVAATPRRCTRGRGLSRSEGCSNRLIWRMATVTVLGRENLRGPTVRSWWCPTTPAISTPR